MFKLAGLNEMANLAFGQPYARRKLLRCFKAFALDNVGRCHGSPHLHDGGSGLALRGEDAEAIESPEPGLPEPEDVAERRPS